MLIGYVRPLLDDLDCEEQKNQLLKNNCEKIIQESHASAKRRTELERLIEMLNERDAIVVTKLYALADSTHHLVELLEEIERKEAFLISIAEKIDTSKEESYSFSYIVKHL